MNWLDRFKGQSLVNAQVNVNRAVHEYNKPGQPESMREGDPDPAYLSQKIGEAIESLREARESLPGQGRFDV